MPIHPGKGKLRKKREKEQILSRKGEDHDAFMQWATALACDKRKNPTKRFQLLRRMWFPCA